MIVVVRDKFKCDMLLENAQPLCEAKWVIVDWAYVEYWCLANKIE